MKRPRAKATAPGRSARPTVLSLFCGIGGLDLGFECEDFEVVWANDLNALACATYALNFGREAVPGDLNHLALSELPRADVVIGGPPCQAFSLVGRRRPGDPRGQLVFRFVDVVEEVRPRAFVMENVPGMAASRVHGERLPSHLVARFEALGYRVAEMKLDATDFFVPQRRKRIFLVGLRRGEPTTPDARRFLERIGAGRRPESAGPVTAREAIGDLGAPVGRGELAGYRTDVTPSPFARLLREAARTEVSLHERPRMSETDIELVSHIPPGGNYEDVPDEVATGRILRFKKTGGRTTTYGRLHPDRPSYTINTYFRRPNVGCNFHYAEPRLMTPREAMRFQSIPDRFVIARGSQDQRNALVGNAVPPLLARAIAWSVREALERGQRRTLSAVVS